MPAVPACRAGGEGAGFEDDNPERVSCPRFTGVRLEIVDEFLAGKGGADAAAYDDDVGGGGKGGRRAVGGERGGVGELPEGGGGVRSGECGFDGCRRKRQISLKEGILAHDFRWCERSQIVDVTRQDEKG